MKAAPFVLLLLLLMAACSQPQSVEPPAVDPATPPLAENTPASPEDTEAVDDNPLAGTSWVLDAFGAPGAEAPAVGETPVTLEFSADNQVSGSGGCNSYNGIYQAQEGTLILSDFVS